MISKRELRAVCSVDPRNRRSKRNGETKTHIEQDKAKNRKVEPETSCTLFPAIVGMTYLEPYRKDEEAEHIDEQ